MVLVSPILLLSLLLDRVLAGGKDFSGRVARHGSVGLGEPMYAPVTCAWACRNTMSSWMIECPDDDSHRSMDESMSMMHMDPPSPDCLATSDAYLTSLAWCIKTHCLGGLPLSQLEDFWEHNIAGRIEHWPTPKYSYQDALRRISTTPTTPYNASTMLNGTELVSEFMYEMTYGPLEGIEVNISLDNQLALVALIICTTAPIFLSLLRFIPFPPTVTTKFYAYFIDPPVFGPHHAVPVFFGLGIVPTRGQSLFIVYLWAVNIVFCSVGYVVTWPNLWFETVSSEMVEWVANRTGMLSFANIILAILYSSRNSILLNLTSWSRSTFVIAHRWLAVICILQACIHSALYLQLQVGLGGLAEESAYPYWYWGIIATLALVLILPGSLLPVRQKAYELFLSWHIVWVLLSLVGSFLHIYLRYHWQWGYEIWMTVALSLLALDWLLIRPLRLLRNGLNRRAYVSIIDEDYLQLDIPGVLANGHAYLYFPTLSWRIWENHPFSVVSIHTPRPLPGTPPLEDLESGKAHEPTSTVRAATTLEKDIPGITFFIRRRDGLSEKLAKTAALHANGVRVLVETSYGREPMSLQPSPELRASRIFPNIVYLVGGVGISAILGRLERGMTAPAAKTVLYWGVRSVPLVRAVERKLGIWVDRERGVLRWGSADVTLAIAERFNIRDILQAELCDPDVKGGTVVVVCGPPAMADEARLEVVRLAKQGVLVRFYEERYSS